MSAAHSAALPPPMTRTSINWSLLVGWLRL
jgi:hypothetical protein